MREYGKYIDILAVSCDSFNEDVNVKIGRGKGAHVQNLVPLSKLCLEQGIKFKINTVVNKYNFFEDMNEEIARINPFRWKVFQVLVLEGENSSDKTLRVCTVRFCLQKPWRNPAPISASLTVLLLKHLPERKPIHHHR